METHTGWLLASALTKAASALSLMIHGHNQRFDPFSSFFYFFPITLAFSLSALHHNNKCLLHRTNLNGAINQLHLI